jgi:nitroreductase
MTCVSTTNPTLDVLSSHVSVRSFTDEPVSDDLLSTALEAARRAPTSSNWQTYSIVVVRDQEKKERLAELAGGQRHVAECQAFLAFVADFHRIRRSAQVHGEQPARGLEFTMTPIVDAAIVGEAAQVALESVGLGAVMVGGMRANATAVAEVLGLPHEAFVVYGMSVGWPDGDPTEGGLKPRLPSHVVIHENEYSDDGLEEAFAAYDEALANWYESRGRNLADAAWTGPVARRSSALRYASLRSELEELGFRFD